MALSRSSCRAVATNSPESLIEKVGNDDKAHHDEQPPEQKKKSTQAKCRQAQRFKKQLHQQHLEETETRLREEDEKVQSVQSGDSGTAVFQRLVKKVYDAAQECDAHELRALKLELRLLDGHFVF